MKRYFAASLVQSIAASLLWSTPAAAQPASARPDDRAATAEEVSDDVIVVTAQRREQALKDVPIAITTITGDSLESSGISDTRALGFVTPGLNFVSAGPFAQPTIRGIGTGVADPGSDANVATYVDGVYQASQLSNIFEFNNVERIEVLKGPQGTLFGRNATGGAIRVITQTPDQDLRGKAALSYGRLNEVRADAFVNLPLGEAVAMNVSGLYRYSDGYVRNVATGNDLGEKEIYALRGKLKLDASDRLSFTIGANYSHTRDNAVFAVRPIDGNSASRPLGVVFPDGFYTAAIGPQEPIIRSEVYGFNLTARLDVGAGEIVSISAYQKLKTFLRDETDGGPLFLVQADIPIRAKTLTQEINFISDFDGPFNFTTGVFYYKDKSRAGLDVQSGTGPVADITTSVRTESLSGYLEADYAITDRLQATLGARYSTEKKTGRATLFGAPVVDSSARWNKFTPRAVLKYELTPQANIYASWSRGFKSGSYNLTSLQSDPVSPEDIDAFELGVKFADGRKTFSASAFYYDYRNIQVLIQTSSPGGGLVTVLQNAATARSYGLDAEGTLPVGRSFMLRAGLAWTHARYRDFPGALITTPLVDANGVPIGGNKQEVGDASGSHMIRTPEIQGNLTGEYTTPLAGGEFRMSLTGSYNDGWYWDIGDKAPEDAFFILNAAVSWKDPSERFELFAYGDNLTQAKYRIYVRNAALATDGSPGRPWTAGAGVRVFF